MNQMTPTMPMSAEDMAFFEMGGQRYLVLPLGPAPDVSGSMLRSVQIPPVPAPAPANDTAADVTTTSAPKGSNPAPSKYVYGLKGIQMLFHCSKSTAYNIKRSGRIDEAISQIGNTIIVDAEKALALLKK